MPKAPTAIAPILLTVTSRLTAPLAEPLSSLLPEDELEPPDRLDVLKVELPVDVEVLLSSDVSRPEPLEPEPEQLELEPCDIH